MKGSVSAYFEIGLGEISVKEFVSDLAEQSWALEVEL